MIKSVIDPQELCDTPWGHTYAKDGPQYGDKRSAGWNGDVVACEPGVDTSFFGPSEVEAITDYFCNFGSYDGNEVVVGRLRDGRWFGWETWRDATGSGFYEDAYGGHENVYVSRTREGVIASLSETRREDLLGTGSLHADL